MQYFTALRNLKAVLAPDGTFVPRLELILACTRVGYGLEKAEPTGVKLAKGIEIKRVKMELDLKDIDNLIAHLQTFRKELELVADETADCQIEVPK